MKPPVSRREAVCAHPTGWLASVHLFRFDRLGEVCQAAGSLEEAKDCYQKEISLYEQIYAEVKTEEFRNALSKVYTKLSGVLSQGGLAEQAAQYAEKASRILEEQA